LRDSSMKRGKLKEGLELASHGVSDPV
jgi:hypothetical protein